MKNIAIIGAGAVGSIILHLISNDKSLNIDIFATKNRGINLQIDNKKISLPYNTQMLIESSKKYDVIFITTKAYTLKDIIPYIDNITHPETIIIICQNGYSQTERITHPNTFHAVVYISGQKKDDIVIYFRDNRLVLPNDVHTKKLQSIFLNTDLDISISDDYLQQIWFKLLVNLGINSMTALTKNTAQILKVVEVNQALIQLLKEGITVANKDGLSFNDDTIDEIISIYKGYPDHMGTSMYYDVLENALTEYEFIQGYIYERARHHQLSTPTLDIVYALLKGYQYNR
ncbi:oxidoreductase [Macrococcoides bohemicum]|uniref:oxidoreductase n=1 Tax=Macrococcoides bohemicum TaxID=1903056 RepID=UPI0010599316|nr:oxidoreductase [Macrococcus bohemicus]QRN49789.1 oxidoreductase [Macrococcus bohemicus]TDL37101.1 oxidoreductase [Macrococcus bohemicus]